MATGISLKGLPRVLKWLLAGLMFIIGLAVGALGIKLATVGGTWFFALMGLVMIVAAALIARNRRSGIALYALAFIVALIWSVSDAGWDFWPLFSRLFTFGVLAFLCAIIWPFLSVSPHAKKGPAFGLAAVIAVVLLASLGGMFKTHTLVSADEEVPVKPVTAGEQQKNWTHWGNTTHGDRFAALDQINKQNVDKLQVAWVAHTGDIPVSNGSGAEDQNTPLQVGDTLFVCTPYSKVLALDVDSGKEKWRYDSKATAPNWQRCRGLGYYEESQKVTTAENNSAPAACPRRLFLPTTDARLIAINADTGKPCADFGDNGVVDLSVGMGEIKPGYYQQTSTPLVAGNVVVLGGRVADNFSTDEPPGVVRAYDVHTGKLAWAWDPGNPNITGLPPEGQTYTRGTPNVWSAMSYDAKLNLVYLPTGNATPDFWAGERTALDDKYSSSIVAVDATTGKVRWHYQTTHHDLWDFDLPSQPLLTDLPDGKGGTTPVLVQTSKQGMIFMLNRETGEPGGESRRTPGSSG
jgi:Glucose dehydrogenase